MKQSFAIDKEQLEYLYVQLEEEAKSVGMYRKAAKHDAERYRSSLRGLQAQIDVAQKEFHRADELVESGSISRSMWDERRKELLELEAQRDGVSQQLQLAEENVRSAKDGKFLSDGKTHGEMRELEAKIKIQQRVVEQGELQLSRALGALEQTRITSKVDGTVYAVKREAGTYVRAGESVMTIYVDDAKPWILARFTFEEAERFSPGSRALVYFPSLNEVVDGVVQALGHQAMSIGGAVSQDQEISLTEVPVKIVLLQRPSGLYPGMGASVSIDTPWLRAFKGLF
jgi:multidrug resistance efflux pump